MKIACFADLHANIFKDFDEHSDITGSQRLDKIVHSLQFIKNYCLENKVEYILNAGDTFNTRGKVNTIVQNAIYDEFKGISTSGIKMIILPGNHDEYDNSELPPHSLHVFRDLSNIQVVDDLGVVKIPTWDLLTGDDTFIDVVCVPYNKNVQKIKDFIDGYQSDSGCNRGILLFHLGVSGSVSGSNSYPMAEAFNLSDLCPDKFKYLVGGHIHKRQLLDGLPNAFYCGAPIQHSFNDEGEEKGFYIIDTSEKCSVKFVPIPNPEFITLKPPFVKKQLEALASDGDYVRVQLKQDELPEFMSIIPQGLKYKIELQKEYKQELRSDVKIGMSFQEIVSKYADDYNLDAKEIGLKILEEVEGEK